MFEPVSTKSSILNFLPVAERCGALVGAEEVFFCKRITSQRVRVKERRERFMFAEWTDGFAVYRIQQCHNFAAHDNDSSLSLMQHV